MPALNIHAITVLMNKAVLNMLYILDVFVHPEGTWIREEKWNDL